MAASAHTDAVRVELVGKKYDALIAGIQENGLRTLINFNKESKRLNIDWNNFKYFEYNCLFLSHHAFHFRYLGNGMRSKKMQKIKNSSY